MGRVSVGTRLRVEASNDALVDWLGRELIGSRLWFAPGQTLCRRSTEDAWEENPAVRDWLLRIVADELDAIGGVLVEETTLRRNLEMSDRNREILIRLRDWQRLTKVPRPEDLPRD